MNSYYYYKKESDLIADLEAPEDGETEERRIERETENFLKSLPYYKSGSCTINNVVPHGRTGEEYQEIAKNILIYLEKEVAITPIALDILHNVEELIQLKSRFD